MKTLGCALGLLGVALMLTGFLSSGTPAYSDTFNIGLLNEKSNFVTGGGLLAVCGSVLYGAGTLLEALVNGVTKATDSVSDGTGR